MTEYEFDEAKSLRNIDDRGFDFDFASRIFEGPIIEFEDNRRDYGEERFIAIGRVDDIYLTVVYTWREHRRRIISARKASRKERDVYDQAINE
ncbi:MAG: BrnT family toxin [Alphaproteobacteria bacterium]